MQGHREKVAICQLGRELSPEACSPGSPGAPGAGSEIVPSLVTAMHSSVTHSVGFLPSLPHLDIPLTGAFWDPHLGLESSSLGLLLGDLT